MRTVLWALALLVSGLLVLVAAFSLAVAIIKPEFESWSTFGLGVGLGACIYLFADIAVHAPSTMRRPTMSL